MSAENPVGIVRRRLRGHAAALLVLLPAAAAAPVAGDATPEEAPRGTVTPPRTVAAPPRAAPPSVVLLTLDTTRADALGCYGAERARTPALDALAARGTRFARAVTPSPLTLPAHTSLLTGLDPPEHGVRDNGTAALGAAVPTLATVLAARGWRTGAFVASRVLDRRFGLGVGFVTYDDRMAAENLGEYGYPERDAAAVVDAALTWAEGLPRGEPYFLWAHFYDPHSPYAPPPRFSGSTPEERYAGEVAHVDEQIGRLLAGLPGEPSGRLVVAVGDHGEALGEHGERSHGIFLYRASLEVPLVFAGPGVPAGRVVEATVGTRGLAAATLALLGLGEAADPFGNGLPGLASGKPAQPADGEEPPTPVAIYSETLLPATAYGWSALKALTAERTRLVVAPRPELYDFVADPAEAKNLLEGRRQEARRLRDLLAELEAGFASHRPEEPADGAELAASLRALGYLSGTSGSGTAEVDPRKIDPKDGIGMLAELEEAKRRLDAGHGAEALSRLEDLAARSPGNVPFLTQLARARLQAGQGAAAVAAYREAVKLNPRLDFLHLNLAQALLRTGEGQEAKRELELTVEINPRSAQAWLLLGEMANAAGKAAEERRLLLRAVEAGTTSALLLARLGQVELAAGDPESAAERFRQATELLPDWVMGWYLRGLLAHQRGATAAAREFLERAAALSPGSPQGREARRLLGTLPAPAPRSP